MYVRLRSGITPTYVCSECNEVVRTVRRCGPSYCTFTSYSAGQPIICAIYLYVHYLWYDYSSTDRQRVGWV